MPDAMPTWKDAINPQFVKLAPGSALAAATGQPVGTIVLFGVERKVRCATYVDLAAVEALTGKNPLGGLNIAKDCTIEQVLKVAALAVDPPFDVDAAMRGGIGEHRKVLEVVTAFLWVGELSAE